MKPMEINAPEIVGMSASRLNQIDTTMQAFIDQSKFAGIATLIARYGKVAHFGCYGKLDLAANKPIQARARARSSASGPPWWSGIGYGFGVGVQVTDEPRVGWISACGWIGRSGTTAWIHPREEMIVIAMPQADRDWEASDTLLKMAREAIAT